MTLRASVTRKKDELGIRTFIAIALIFLRAWMLMIGFDVLHQHWPQIPAFSFRHSLVLLCMLVAIVGVFKTRFYTEN